MTSPVFHRLTLSLLLFTPVVVSGQALTAPPAAGAPDMIDRIFKMREFTLRSALQPQWFDEGASYVLIEPAGADEQVNVVRYDSATGNRREVLITPAQLTPPGARTPLAIADLSWSGDGQRVPDLHEHAPCLADGLAGRLLAPRSRTGQLRKLGGEAPEASLMYATFNPGRHEGRLRAAERHLRRGRRDRRHHADYSRRIRPRRQRRLRLGQRRGARSPRLLSLEPRWAPDRVLAVRSARRRQFLASCTTSERRTRSSRGFPTRRRARIPVAMSVPYPLAGDDELGGARRRRRRQRRGGEVWLQLPGDPREHYIARLQWADADTLLVQQLNRLQNTDAYLLADARAGRRMRCGGITTKRSSPLDLEAFRKRGRSATALSFSSSSEKDGWMHVYRVARDGRETLVTRGEHGCLRDLGRRREGRLAVLHRVAAERRRSATCIARRSTARRIRFA